jgi:hypothetical protein
MLYKVTPMLVEEAAPKQAREPRKRRKSAVYDADGHEVLISLMCLKCKTVKPLVQFGLRKMADGALRNQPWCRTCRGAKPQKPVESVAAAEPSAGPVTVEMTATVEPVQEVP